MLSEQLCREYGKNTVHKKMLQVSLGLMLPHSSSLARTGIVGFLVELWVFPISAAGEDEGAYMGAGG